MTPETYIKQQIAKEGLSAGDIRLGLERVSRVLSQMELRPPPFIFTLAGTNGKGSCANLIYTALLKAGHPAALFTSPHLLRFNERACIAGKPAEDAEWLLSLERVSKARAKTGAMLTYFEYCALAAFDMFSRKEASPWVLEAGLGGRLDAVNVLNTTCAVITSIDLDHTERLGKDRASIGLEKLGVARPGVPLICGDPNPPQPVIRAAKQMGAKLLRVNRDYGAQDTTLDEYRFADAPPLEYTALSNSQIRNRNGGEKHAGQSEPVRLCVTGSDQLAINLATAWQALNTFDTFDAKLVTDAWENTRLIGRWQRIRLDRHTLILDTGHNPQAARIMVRRLKTLKKRLTLKNTETPPASAPKIIFAMRADKDWREFLAIVSPHIKEWHLFPLFTQNGNGVVANNANVNNANNEEEISVPKHALIEALHGLDCRTHWYESAKQLTDAIRADKTPTLFWVCGSFRTLGEMMCQLDETNTNN